VQRTSLLDPRLLLVTGKGGVGKSTVAAALAVAGVATGRRTCLVEVEGRQTMARLFSTEPWDFTEREFRPGLWGLSIDPEASLAEYLELFYGAGRISKFVVGSTAVEFATTAAPGIKDVLLIGKVKEMERRRDPDGRFHYDLVIVDAPPTGRIINFLRSPDATTELVGVGPIRQQAQSVVDMVLDPQRTHLQLVTLLEEMPVEETIDSVAALRDLGVTVGPVLVNRVHGPAQTGEVEKAIADLDGETVREVAESGGLRVDAKNAEALVARGARYLERLELERRMRERLHGKVRLPTVELPFLASRSFGDAEIHALAEMIEEAVR
jgi:anion-transporting  ArsA/GET3 family ATPase